MFPYNRLASLAGVSWLQPPGVAGWPDIGSGESFAPTDEGEECEDTSGLPWFADRAGARDSRCIRSSHGCSRSRHPVLPRVGNRICLLSCLARNKSWNSCLYLVSPDTSVVPCLWHRTNPPDALHWEAQSEGGCWVSD